MTQFLPPNLLALFAPREPIPFMPPVDKLPHEKKQTHNYQGIAQYVHLFEDPVDTPAPTEVETREQRRDRRKKEKAEQVAYKLEQEIALWDPNSIVAEMGDPFKTMFCARINFYTSESKIRREFEQYGSIKNIKLIHNTKDGKPRGYAFIEFESEKDMHSAYKHADGKKLDGRRVLVDVERGRTVKGWLPRRLGGGLGGTRKGGPEVNVRHSGRDDSRRERGGDRGEGRRRSRSRSREKRRRSRSRDRKPKRSRSRERKRSRSGGERRKRSKRSRSRSRERRRRERREAGIPDEFKVKEEPADYNEGGNYDYQGVNVKQERVDNDGRNGAEQPEEKFNVEEYQQQQQQNQQQAEQPPVDRNLPMSAPGEEEPDEYNY